MSVTGSSCPANDPGWSLTPLSRLASMAEPNNASEHVFFPFKSPAVVINYSCNEKPVPNLVWISLILGTVKSPRKGLVMGYNIPSLFWPMSVSQLCVCVCTCTRVCVCARMSVKGGESKGAQKKQ